MCHSIDYHPLAFHFEEHPIVSRSKPVFGREISESLHVSSEVVFHSFDPFNYAPSFALVNGIRSLSARGLNSIW